MITKQLPGTDIIATLAAKDADGAAIDLTALQGFVLYAYVKPNRIIAQFAEPSAINYSEIDSESDLASGIIKIKIPGDKTKELSDQKIHLVMYARTDGPEPVVFGTAEGTAYELVHITSSPNPAMP